MINIPGTIQNVIQLTPEQTSVLIGAGNKLTNLDKYSTKQIALKLLGVVSDGLFDTDYLAVAMIYPQENENEYIIDVRDFQDSKTERIIVSPDVKFDKKLQKILSRIHHKTKVIGAIIEDDSHKINIEIKEKFIDMLRQVVTVDTAEAHLFSHLNTHFQRAGFSLFDTPSDLTISNYSDRKVVIRVINGSIYIDKYKDDKRKDIERIKGHTTVAHIMKETFDYFKYKPYEQYDAVMKQLADMEDVKNFIDAFTFFPYDPKTDKVYVLHNDLNFGRRVRLNVNVLAPLMEAFNYISNPKPLSVTEAFVEPLPTVNMLSAKEFYKSAKDVLEDVFGTKKIHVKGSVITIKYSKDMDILLNRTTRGFIWSYQETNKERSKSKLALDKNINLTHPQVRQKLVSEILATLDKMQAEKKANEIKLLTRMGDTLKEKYDDIQINENMRTLSFKNEDDSIVAVFIDKEMLMWQVSKKINDDKTIQTDINTIASIEEMQSTKDVEAIIFDRIIQQLDKIVLEIVK